VANKWEDASAAEGGRGVPGGADTEILLTSVGDWEHGKGRPPTIDRLFMRLRIFWFFLMAIPVVAGAGIVAGAVTALADAILGAGGRSITGALGLGAFPVAAVGLVWLFARWFDRLTRGYRARLEARAVAQSAAAAARVSERARAQATTPRRLAELDARLAPRDQGRPPGA
jgi:hypothetical protein